jgi:drug/metabolite transporter (DMT)-like permease
MTSWAPNELFHFFFRAFTSGTVWIGIGLLLAYFVAYLLVLSWADYSYVQPASSASYVLIALLAHFVLRETISPLRWAGVAVICTGVFVVGHTHPQTPEHHSW